MINFKETVTHHLDNETLLDIDVRLTNAITTLRNIQASNGMVDYLQIEVIEVIEHLRELRADVYSIVEGEGVPF